VIQLGLSDCENGADDSYNDMLESELSGEVENGRLVRLMIKLGFINERAE
jgi:PAB-dependent poly(A)-specific ribonuclease subunit 3